MGDFFLDFRSADRRKSNFDCFRFFSDLESDHIRTNIFDLYLTRVGSAALWAPYKSDDGTVVALAGRIALDTADWGYAKSIPGQGGLACKAIFRLLKSDGYEAVQRLNGAYVIHIFEPVHDRYTMITDEGGAYPCFGPVEKGQFVFSSHPDILAKAISAADDWDISSLAGFVSTGQVPHPFSYYRGIMGLERGTRYSLDLTGGGNPVLSWKHFARKHFQIAPAEDVGDLADQLISAVSRVSQQVTDPILGKTFVTISGGLDCRLLVSHANRHENLHGVSIRGSSRNSEFRIAESIVKAADIELIPLVRKFDHYADNAEQGIRISGGMGNIWTNHFLGFREKLRESGCDNLVTGDLFDYLFKSLALDVKESAILRREKLTGFQRDNYLPYFRPTEKYCKPLEERFNSMFPDALTSDHSEVARLRISALRTFPLSRTGTDIHRQVAHRVFGWYAPAVFRDLLEIYWRTPLKARIGKLLFGQVILKSVLPGMSGIPDSNTGLPVDASKALVTLFRYRIAYRRHLERNSNKIGTDDSWVNWPFYLRNSQVIRDLWARPGGDAAGLIEELTGSEFSSNIDQYLSVSIHYFLRLLSVKIWAEQRENR